MSTAYRSTLSHSGADAAHRAIWAVGLLHPPRMGTPGGRALRTTQDRAMRSPHLGQTTQSLQIPTGRYPILCQRRLRSPKRDTVLHAAMHTHQGLSSALPSIQAAVPYLEEAAAFTCAGTVQARQVIAWVALALLLMMRYHWLCRDVTLMVKATNAMRSQGPPSQNESSSQSLHAAKSMGNLNSKPSWTKLQQDNLKAKRGRTQHQSSGFNGLVQAAER